MDIARTNRLRPGHFRAFRRGAWLFLALAAGLAAGFVLPAEALGTKGKRDRDRAVQKSEKDRKPPAKSEPAAPAPPPVEPEPIIVRLTSDKGLYVTGDRLTIRVEADKACNLTLIGIEASGLATVLLPNDIEPDNALAAGVARTVPAPEAGYALRLDKPGIESVLAICTAKARRPFGIGHDYEHQRFTLLGSWATWADNAAAREAEHMSRVAEENRKRARLRRNPLPQIVDPPPAEREPEGRALMLVPVEAPDPSLAVTSTTARAP